MSELIQNNDNRATIRWKLLTSVSAAALAISSVTAAKAEDTDRPLVWIELGGQLEQLSDSQQSLSPPFMASITQANLQRALNVQNPPAYAIGDEAKITFQPESSDWVFSASIQYGRTGANKHHHQQTANKTILSSFNLVLPPPYGTHHIGPKYYYPSRFAKFSDGQSSQSQKNLVLDFQAGKDVGLGMFGGHGSSVVSAGVRIAQFTSKSNVTLRAIPDLQYPTAPITNKYEALDFRHAHIRFHNYAATASSSRSFRGVGPSLSWNASMPIAGTEQSGEITLDWGMNAALLFGRQKARGHHQTTAKAYSLTNWDGANYQFQKNGKTVHQGFFQNHQFQVGSKVTLPTYEHTNSSSFNRTRNVTVPNLGGSAGVSVRYSDVKFSVGYKADFFFGAIDGGIDTRKDENRGFFGPYASISVGFP